MFREGTKCFKMFSVITEDRLFVGNVRTIARPCCFTLHNKKENKRLLNNCSDSPDPSQFTSSVASAVPSSAFDLLPLNLFYTEKFLHYTFAQFSSFAGFSSRTLHSALHCCHCSATHQIKSMHILELFT